MTERPTTKKAAIALLRDWAKEESPLTMAYTNALCEVVDEFKRRVALLLVVVKSGDCPISIPFGLPEEIDEELIGELMVEQFAEACTWFIETLELHEQYEACLDILGPRGVNAVLFGHPIPKADKHKADETAKK